MSYNFHSDTNVYFSHQYLNAKEHVLPFIEPYVKLDSTSEVLEIGCGEGGVLRPFSEKGCTVIGVDLNDAKIQAAREFYKEEISNGKADFISKNIYDDELARKFVGKFDLIILKDAIEHIHDQEKIISYLKGYLKPNGKIFFGFPPWYNPFGGHQQICDNKLLDKLPYFHILPKTIYRLILKTFGEQQSTIDELLEIKSLGITIERFNRILRKTGYKVTNRTHFFINPIYKYKFGFRPRKINKLIDSLPYIRNFFTTAVYYLIEPVNKGN